MSPLLVACFLSLTPQTPPQQGLRPAVVVTHDQLPWEKPEIQEAPQQEAPKDTPEAETPKPSPARLMPAKVKPARAPKRAAKA